MFDQDWATPRTRSFAARLTVGGYGPSRRHHGMSVLWITGRWRGGQAVAMSERLVAQGDRAVLRPGVAVRSIARRSTCTSTLTERFQAEAANGADRLSEG